MATSQLPWAQFLLQVLPAAHSVGIWVTGSTNGLSQVSLCTWGPTWNDTEWILYQLSWRSYFSKAGDTAVWKGWQGDRSILLTSFAYTLKEMCEIPDLDTRFANLCQFFKFTEFWTVFQLRTLFWLSPVCLLQWWWHLPSTVLLVVYLIAT